MRKNVIRLFVPEFSIRHMENFEEFVAYKNRYWGNEIEVEVPEDECYWSERFKLFNVWTHDWKIVSE